MSQNKHTNKLINEKSPYLLQHAHNPVNWYPWNEEAFEKAKKEDKPIFLSIGYSTCHWCHVMEHESFEDTEVAELMNQTFVSIKVDREERPDIDNIYMTVCQMMTGGGGWPLTIIMTPQKEPFFSGTYFPKENRYGRIGLIDLIKRIGEAWKTKRKDIEESADTIVDYLKQNEYKSSNNSIDKSIIQKAYEELENRYDDEYGGFGSAPKFPSPHNLTFLLRYWKNNGSEQALQMVEKTLLKMRMGGVFDHIGFGFHRYSTDREWLVPHFEKMLYDQAMLVIAYTETFQATKNPIFKRTAEEVLEYVLRDMTPTSVGGGFYSAEDADSEGEEGKFYVWTEDELKNILSNSEFNTAKKIFNINADGNYEVESTRAYNGTNILHLSNITEESLNEIETIRKKLFEIRKKRIHPYKDDKILTDWNGLMIAALAKASRVFQNQKYVNAAEKCLEFIYKNLFVDGILLHRYRENEAAVKANLDDYSFLIWGLIELYEATLKPDYLQKALILCEKLNISFLDKNGGGYYFTSDKSEKLLTRTKEIYDGAIPSGNSVMMMNLIKLDRMTGETRYEEIAAQMNKFFSKRIEQTPPAFTQLLSAVGFQLNKSFEIIIVGDKFSDDTKKIFSALNEIFIPNKVVIFIDKDNPQPIYDIAGYTKNYEMINGKTTVYVCKNYKCNLPTNDVNKMLELLEENN